MYGLVNKAIQELVIKNYGEERWNEIKQKVGFQDNFFVGMKSYPDDLTYDLVGTISQETGLSAEEVLQAFGEYWILFTAEEGYREIMKVYGSTLREFLLNLNRLHDQVGLIMPDLRPPKFTVSELTENHISLTYESKREGLAPMVVGLLRGLGRKFDQDITIEQTEFRSTTGKDVFSIKW